jgi:hypothetical protein
VEPGSVIEYRYTRSAEVLSHYLRLDFSREMPVRLVQYEIKPYVWKNGGWAPRLQFFHCLSTPLELQPDGFYRTALANVPAFKREPYAPPENQIRPWSLFYYVPFGRSTTDKFWTELGKGIYSAMKPHLKVTGAVTKTASEVASKGNTPLEKLDLLSLYCRTRIKNVQTESVTAEERTEADKNRIPEDTLTHGEGTGEDIRFLFAAMAISQGFEAQVAALPSRAEVFFTRDLLDGYFLRYRAIAVKVNGEWRFYDPANTYEPRGGLAWYNEGVPALLCDPKGPTVVETPNSTPEASTIHQEGTLKLSADGTLEGDVILRYMGHAGAIRKTNAGHLSQAQREDAVTSILKQRGGSVEVSDIRIENEMDAEKPLTYRCHVRISGYAERTGKRLLFAPALF